MRETRAAKCTTTIVAGQNLSTLLLGVLDLSFVTVAGNV